jgi:hypothetical protein
VTGKRTKNKIGQTRKREEKTGMCGVGFEGRENKGGGADKKYGERSDMSKHETGKKKEEKPKILIPIFSKLKRMCTQNPICHSAQSFKKEKKKFGNKNRKISAPPLLFFGKNSRKNVGCLDVGFGFLSDNFFR